MAETDADTTLILVRHGESVWNLEGRVQGQQQGRLTAQGRDQGQRLADRLSRAKLDAVYSSDLARARETAELIAAPHGLAVELREDLRERSFGVLEGKTLDEAARTMGPWFLLWQEDRLRNSPPGGETQPEMCARVMEALRDIASSHPGAQVAVSTHGGPVKSAVYDVLRIPLSLWTLTFIANASITILRGIPDLMRLVTFNDVCHLEPAWPPGGESVE